MPQLVGREQELATLAVSWDKTLSGSPQAVLLTGEAGVGKTSLLGEFLGGADATVLSGGCMPVAGEAMPFAPIIQALRGLDPSHRARLVEHWPGSAEPGLEYGLDAPVSSTTQVRLFESVLSLLAEVAGGRPVVLVVEDLHWSDRSTLDLVGFLTRSLRSEPLLLVMTVRTEDLPRRHPLRGWLAELARLSHVERVALSRLDRDRTRQHLTALLGKRPDDDLLDLVFDHSAGNPLFTEQLLPWTEHPERQVPETLHDLVAERFAALPDHTQHMLEIAAVLGPATSLRLLAAVAAESETDVEEALREAVDRNLVLPRMDASYAFAHPLFREVLERDLLPGQRQRLHGAAARALAGRTTSGGGPTFAETAEIARHWESAGEPDLAFPAAVEAGLAAERACAFADANEHLELAVQLAGDRADDAFASLPVDRIELLMHAAQAADLMGDGTRAVKLAQQAATLSRDPLQQAHILERQGGFSFNSGLPDQAREAYKAALALLPADEPSADRARMFAGLAILAMGWSRFDEAEVFCRQAIDISQLVGARREEGRASNAMGVVIAYRGEFANGIALLRTSLQIAEEIDDPDDLSAAYIDLAHVLGIANRFDEAVEVCRQGYDAMRRVGLVRQAGSFLHANAAESRITAGRWDQADILLSEALGHRSRGLRSVPVLKQHARLLLARGDLAAAATQLRQLEEMLVDVGAPDMWRRGILELSAELALWQHRPDAALAAVRSGLALVESEELQRFAGQLFALGLRSVSDSAEAARARQEPTELDAAQAAGDDLVARARIVAPDPLDEQAHVLPQDRATALTARAELARLRGEPAADLWAEAAQAWETVGHPFPAAYARWREAEAVVLAKPGGERPVTAVRAAYTAATSLGAAALVKEVEQLARWGRVDLEAGGATGLPVQRSVDAVGLTSRELEVLAGLVAGRTNREIAEALFISVKTASVHVSNILRKLDVANREEAARAGHRLGITPARR